MTLIYFFIVSSNSIQEDCSRAGKQKSFPSFPASFSEFSLSYGREERGRSDPVLWNTSCFFKLSSEMAQFPICGTKMKKLVFFCALFCISGLWEQSTLAVM